jgi:hypothetical protein
MMEHWALIASDFQIKVLNPIHSLDNSDSLDLADRQPSSVFRPPRSA